MKIYTASDHAGFDLKNKVLEFLLSQKYETEDMGDFKADKDDDYPIFISRAAEKVSSETDSRGIIFGKSGSGEEIVANKFPNVRAVVGFNSENVRLAREDNNANVLSLGSEFIDEEKAIELVKVFLDTPFSNEERHNRRLNEISDIENE